MSENTFEYSASECLLELVRAFNRDDWDRYDAVVTNHFLESFELRFPDENYKSVNRKRFLINSRKAKRFFPEMHYEAKVLNENESYLVLEIQRKWQGSDPGQSQAIAVFSLQQNKQVRTAISSCWEYLYSEKAHHG